MHNENVDSIGAKFGGDRDGELGHGSLGHAVYGSERIGHHSRWRGSEADGSLFEGRIGDHTTRKEMRESNSDAEVDIEVGVLTSKRSVGKQAHGNEPGIIEKEMDSVAFSAGTNRLHCC